MNAIANSQKKAKHDLIFTPPSVAQLMIDMCSLRDGQTVLDPCRGDGAFYNLFPSNVQKEWFEIAEEKDFFDCKEHFDWIVGNPPYSMWDKWLEHTMAITDNFCYLFSFLNFTPNRLKKIYGKGFGLTKLHIVKVDWWFSQSIIAVFEKGKPSIVSVEHKTVQCECGKRCGRGRNGTSYNVCNQTKPLQGQ
eukprot:Lithocolla_globosa_v1_NODE_3842_length_1558_cov_16.637326.p1 type:complete len:191 gc:universal NODE_3842_length_1558_cov_16.637326:121-693(+)